MRALLSLTILLAGLLAGCFGGDDPAGPTGPSGTIGPEPVTPDELMHDFATVYEDLDLETYRDEILDPRYRFVLKPSVVDDYSLPDSVLSFDDEVAIAGRLFGGATCDDGWAVGRIDIESLQSVGLWQDVGPDDAYFGDVAGAKSRTYDVRVMVHAAGVDAQHAIEGTVVFYVAGHEVEHSGQTVTVYRLLGQWDFTGDQGKGTERASWSGLKARFR